MSNAYPFILSLITGALAGTLFFEGLWRTVSRAVGHSRPLRLFVLSFAVRTSLLLAVLWLVSRGGASALAAFLAGFFLARIVIVRIHRGGNEIAN